MFGVLFALSADMYSFRFPLMLMLVCLAKNQCQMPTTTETPTVVEKER